MTTGDSVDPVPLHRIKSPPHSFHFAVEGHLYETGSGDRQFLVFTAGDGSVWSATEPQPGNPIGRYLVRSADSRASCVKELGRVLADG